MEDEAYDAPPHSTGHEAGRGDNWVAVVKAFRTPDAPTSHEAADVFRRKIAFMMKDLPRRGYSVRIGAPPFYRMAWACGWQLIPPLFAPLGQSAAFLGALFAIFWGTAMTLMGASALGLAETIAFAGSGGTLFGFVMAWNCRRLHTKMRLPPWEKYGDPIPEPAPLIAAPPAEFHVACPWCFTAVRMHATGAGMTVGCPNPLCRRPFVAVAPPPPPLASTSPWADLHAEPIRRHR